MSTVGAIRPTAPSEPAIPNPVLTCPVGLGSSRLPYMYSPRRVIAWPAYTFSDTACSRKPSGAKIGTSPAPSGSTPFTPPK
jgi:hypothetical protein